MVGTPNPALEAYLDKLRERFDKAAAEYKEKYVRDTFRAFDSDNGGTIDPEEFRRLCKRISPTMSEEDIADAIRLYYTATHNLAEGAGAAPLAALMQERARMKGKKVGVILSGGNIDMGWFRTVLEGDVPEV